MPDNIRNAMNMLMGMRRCWSVRSLRDQNGGYTAGFSIVVAIYFSTNPLGPRENGGTGRSSNDHRILLNVLYWLGLFVPA